MNEEELHSEPVAKSPLATSLPRSSLRFAYPSVEGYGAPALRPTNQCFFLIRMT